MFCIRRKEGCRPGGLDIEQKQSPSVPSSALAHKSLEVFFFFTCSVPHFRTVRLQCGRQRRPAGAAEGEQASRFRNADSRRRKRERTAETSPARLPVCVRARPSVRLVMLNGSSVPDGRTDGRRKKKDITRSDSAISGMSCCVRVRVPRLTPRTRNEPVETLGRWAGLHPWDGRGRRIARIKVIH